MRNLLPLALALLVLSPSARAAPYDVDCDAEPGNVAVGGVDIVGMRSGREEGGVVVRIRYADDPGALTATHSLTVDFERDEDPDLAYFDDGGGSFRGSPVYWDAYPVAEGNEIVYRLQGTDVAADALEDAPKWTIAATASSFDANAAITDRASCVGSAGGAAVPAPAPFAAAMLVAALALLWRR